VAGWHYLINKVLVQLIRRRNQPRQCDLSILLLPVLFTHRALFFKILITIMLWWPSVLCCLIG